MDGLVLDGEVDPQTTHARTDSALPVDEKWCAVIHGRGQAGAMGGTTHIDSVLSGLCSQRCRCIDPLCWIFVDCTVYQLVDGASSALTRWMLWCAWCAFMVLQVIGIAFMAAWKR